jgi:hypothetical protein
MKIKIAVDSNIGNKRIHDLSNIGYEVVVVAKPAEKDVDWMERANKAEARFIISNDSDVPRLIENRFYAMMWVNYPGDNPLYKESLVKYIDQMIKYKLQICKLLFLEAR